MTNWRLGENKGVSRSEDSLCGAKGERRAKWFFCLKTGRKLRTKGGQVRVGTERKNVERGALREVISEGCWSGSSSLRSENLPFRTFLFLLKCLLCLKPMLTLQNFWCIWNIKRILIQIFPHIPESQLLYLLRVKPFNLIWVLKQVKLEHGFCRFVIRGPETGGFQGAFHKNISKTVFLRRQELVFWGWDFKGFWVIFNPWLFLRRALRCLIFHDIFHLLWNENVGCFLKLTVNSVGPCVQQLLFIEHRFKRRVLNPSVLASQH